MMDGNAWHGVDGPRVPILGPGEWWTHALGDDPRDCWACSDDDGPHDPEPSGELDHDEETGDYRTLCVCGHALEVDR